MKETPFGKFILLDHVGKGGMGSVYRARDTETDRVVAVKVFRSGKDRAPETSRQLRDREVKMLVSARHPNLVKFFDSGCVDEDYYYSMEFVEENLLDLMRGDVELEIADAVQILRQTAGALAALHNQGVVHRDVKPGNILLDTDPTGAIHVKLTDLGIAKVVDEGDIVQEQTRRRIPGTPRYLSPEQITRQPLDGRSDIFSLGVMAYELLSGEKPFKADNSRGYLVANIKQNPEPLHELDEDIPSFLGRVVKKMLAKNRENRYDAETLERDLQLAYQHLVSGASLVEQTNPDSLFYLPSPENLRGGMGGGRFIAPISRYLAGFIVVAGLLVTALLWPTEPVPVQPPDTPPDPNLLLLRDAEEALREGRPWQAMGLAGEVPEDEIPTEEVQAPARIRERARDRLAERWHAAAARMLEQNRPEEARVVLERMREFFPGSDVTARLAEKL